VFRAATLREYAAIVFLSTSGEVLDEAGREALTGYMAAGGAWLGIHGRVDHRIRPGPGFGDLAGARFDQHPPVQARRDHRRGQGPPGHRASRRGPGRDAMSGTRSRTTPGRRVPPCCSPSTRRATRGARWGADHPIAWCHERLGGRSFYNRARPYGRVIRRAGVPPPPPRRPVLAHHGLRHPALNRCCCPSLGMLGGPCGKESLTSSGAYRSGDVVAGQGPAPTVRAGSCP